MNIKKMDLQKFWFYCENVCNSRSNFVYDFVYPQRLRVHCEWGSLLISVTLTILQFFAIIFMNLSSPLCIYQQIIIRIDAVFGKNNTAFARWLTKMYLYKICHISIERFSFIICSAAYQQGARHPKIQMFIIKVLLIFVS